MGRKPNPYEAELVDFTDDTFISPTEAAALLYELQGKADEYYEDCMRECGLSPTGWHIIFNYIGVKVTLLFVAIAVVLFKQM